MFMLVRTDFRDHVSPVLSDLSETIFINLAILFQFSYALHDIV
jgi:hypothetical protein